MISIEKAILLNVCTGLSIGETWICQTGGDTSARDVPKTLILNGYQLSDIRKQYKEKTEPFFRAVNALCQKADEIIELGPWSVVDKTSLPPSGNLHDYYSINKYGWPNPNTPDGLPYLSRDGEINPACYSSDFDALHLVEFSEALGTLSLAAYLAGKDDYSRRAAKLVNTWFLDEETRQTPHFIFAQTVPGKDATSFTGIVEARHLIYVTESIRLLHLLGALSGKEYSALEQWYTQLLKWLCQSRAGAKAKGNGNNISLWYDLQCLAYAQFVGDTALVEEITRYRAFLRIEEQVELDGSLPRELKRTNPSNYVAFTLVALAQLSRIGEEAGVRLWDSQTGDGRNFHAVHDWLTRLAASRGLRDFTIPLLAELHDEAGQADTIIDEQLLIDLFMQLGILERIAEGRRHMVDNRDDSLVDLQALIVERDKEIERLKKSLDKANNDLARLKNDEGQELQIVSYGDQIHKKPES